MLVIEPADPRAPGPRALLSQSHALLQRLFAPEDNYFLDIEALCGDDICFFAARRGGATLGIGALAVRPGYGEIKSMFTDETARGKGVGAALLRRLEAEARARHLPVLRLETAAALDAAIRLYARQGFTRCGRFGDYRPNDVSVFMHKRLPAPPPG